MKILARLKAINWGKISVVGIPYVWLILFLLIPFLIIFKISMSEMQMSRIPFKDIVSYTGGNLDLKLKLSNYLFIFKDPLYVLTFISSLKYAFLTTLFCLLIGYPFALCMARAKAEHRSTLMMLVILPFWTSFLLRVYAWIGLMGKNSWFNVALTSAYNTVVPDSWAVSSFQMMNTNFAVILVMVYSYLPFMILPLYANLEKLDNTLNEAAMDLGSKPWQVFKDITLPLSIPGIVAGGLLVFIPASGELIIPSLVGNAADPMIGRVIQQEFGANRDWPMASAVAVALLLMLVVPLVVYNYFAAKAQAGAQA